MYEVLILGTVGRGDVRNLTVGALFLAYCKDNLELVSAAYVGYIGVTLLLIPSNSCDSGPGPEAAGDDELRERLQELNPLRLPIKIKHPRTRLILHNTVLPSA